MNASSALHPPLDVPLLSRRTAALLRAHVPLTLLLDLGEPGGPHSDAVYADEVADTGWIPRPRPS